MKIKKIICYQSLLLYLIFTVSAFAGSPVWKISKGTNHLFLGGTVHILSPDDYPLPKAFENAYKNSDILIFEADLKKMNSPGFKEEILKATMYSGSENITHFLEPDTIRDLELYFENHGTSIIPFLKFKPGILATTLTIIELQRLGLTGTGVDEFFSLRALNDQKEILYLETIYDQLNFISAMGDGKENELISYTLKDLKRLPELFGAIKDAWRNGNNTEQETNSIIPLKKNFPELYDTLLVERNKNWIPKIEAMMVTKEIEFFLFGDLHLIGEDGILALLKARGYKIENQ